MNNYFIMADMAILFPSLKAVLTFLAILCIVGGQFEADRIHDEGGSGQQQQNQQQQNQQQQQSLADQFADVYTTLSGGAGGSTSSMMMGDDDDDVVETRKLRALWNGPTGRPLRVALLGWILLLVSVFVDANTHAGFTFHGAWSIGHVVVLLWLLVTQAILVPRYVVEQTVHANAVGLGCATALGYIVWSVLLMLEGGISIFWTLSCAAGVTASWYVFWNHRKRGDAYDRCGVECPARASTFSAGGPLLAAGWCGYWLSLNAVSVILPHWSYIGIYWTSRAECALLGAILVTASQWAVDYAHDEYDAAPTTTTTLESPDNTNPNLNDDENNHHDNSNSNNNNNSKVLLHNVVHIRIVHYTSWFVLAFAAFLPFYLTRIYWAVALFGVMLLQGYATSQQHLLGLRAGSELAYTKRQRAIWLLSVATAVLTGCHSGPYAGILSAVGMVVQQSGQWRLHRDRKRGAEWMATQTVKDQQFQVFSYGALLVPTGMMIWAWGLSMP